MSLRWPQRHKQHKHGDADDAGFHGVTWQATMNTATNIVAKSKRRGYWLTLFRFTRSLISEAAYFFLNTIRSLIL